MANNIRSGDADRTPPAPNARGAISFPINTPDNFRDSYADPALLASNFDAHSRALPFSSQPANVQNVDLSTVNPLAGIQQPGSPIVQVQNVESDLAGLRAMLPFLPIMLTPRIIKTAFMAAANSPVDLEVPTSAALVKFRGPLDYYVSFGGRAVVPIAGGDIDNASIYKPEGEWFYIGGVKSIGVVGPNANTLVQCVFIARPSPNQGF